MEIKRVYNALLLFVGFFILLNVVKDWLHLGNRDAEVMVVNGHRVAKAPCISAMGELFGKGVDSVKMCECMIPRFYQFIKNDTTKMQKFEELGFFPLEGTLNDSATQLFRDCVVENIIDTNYKLNIKQFLTPSTLAKYRRQFQPILNTYHMDFDSTIICAFEKLNGKLTIKEYFADDYASNEKIREAVLQCIASGKRSK